MRLERKGNHLETIVRGKVENEHFIGDKIRPLHCTVKEMTSMA